MVRRLSRRCRCLGCLLVALGGRLGDWQERLDRDPAGLGRIEGEVQAALAEGAGMIVAGLLAVVLASPELAEASERTRQGFGFRLERGRNRTRANRMLGGFVMWATSLYYAPARGWFGKRAERQPGVHVELEQFGFAKGVTPGVESQVARQAAVCLSLELAREGLARGGLKLDGKTVRRIVLQCGEDLLRLRTHWLLEWRAGRLPAGTELAGQRVTVQIDGGRTRLRGNLRDKPALPEPVDENGLLMAEAPGRSR
jgi:hypothetical protein